MAVSRSRAFVAPVGASPIKYLTINDVSGLLQVTPRTVHRYVAAGRLPGFRLAGRGPFRFLASDVDRLLVPEQDGVPDPGLNDFITNQLGRRI